MPIRILYILSTLTRCGPVNLLYAIIKHIDRNEFEPYILTLSPEKHDTLLHQFEALRVVHESLDLSRKDWWLKGQSRLEQRIAQLAPHVIHTHGFRADTGVVRIGFKRHCSTIHNDPDIDYPLEYGKLPGWLLARKHLRIIQSIPHPIAVSRTISQTLSTRIGYSVHSIRNGIDVDFFSPVLLDERKLIRQSLGIQEDEIVFVFAGRFIHRKNPEYVIRAFMEVSPMMNAKLLMLGDGELLQGCRGIANNSVIFTGEVADVHRYYSASDIFISASFGEGLPLAVLEAMSIGLPVLLSDIPSHREIADISDTAVKLFSLDNPNELSKLILHCISTDLSTSKIDARASVRKHFSAATMSAEYQTLYREIIEISDL